VKRLLVILLCGVLAALVGWWQFPRLAAPPQVEKVVRETPTPALEPEVIPIAPAPRAVLERAPPPRVALVSHVAPPPRPITRVSPDPRTLLVPPAVTAKARELIQRLGSEDFREREVAQEALAGMKRMARPALLGAVSTHDDPEVRRRCSELLVNADEDDLRARLEVFLADTENRYEHDIPGMRTFREHLGKSSGMRALAAAVLGRPENRALFAAVEKDVAAGGQAIGLRRHAMYAIQQGWKDPKSGGEIPGRSLVLEEVAALLVAEIAVSSVYIQNVQPNSWLDGCAFIGAVPSRHAIFRNGPHHEAYREIVAKWIDTRRTPAELHWLSGPLTQDLAQFKEAFPALCRTVSTPAVEPRDKCQAMMILARWHPPEQVLPVLRAALKDETLIEMVRFPRPDGTADLYPSRIQDVARAFILFVHKEDVDSFGYEYPAVYGKGRLVDPHFIRDGGYVFRTEEKRAEAAMRFGWWDLKQAIK
jgi:hypothetical protein